MSESETEWAKETFLFERELCLILNDIRNDYLFCSFFTWTKKLRVLRENEEEEEEWEEMKISHEGWS